jgi:hypothetical protein
LLKGIMPFYKKEFSSLPTRILTMNLEKGEREKEN